MADLTVLFDGACALCRASAANVRRFDRLGRIELLDLHDPEAPRRFPQVDREKALVWMQAVDRKGASLAASMRGLALDCCCPDGAGWLGCFWFPAFDT